MMRLNLDLIFLREEGHGVRSISTQVDTCQQAFTQVAFQRNPTIQSSFSDESEGGMRDSIDVSSHNSDVYGASCSSDESNAPTTKDIEAEMRRLNHLFIGSSGRDEVIRVLWSSVVLW
ncbi:uncharacterized protein LOC106380229 isoform X2 [Brassica napus]|uniref:(rape) hypothetical protein n=1 Tax=Brassica napus TaxID=3708 RepID=A0A816LFS7_BRANA|nr:uncharacterized protein LOC106380229 isoform X2 [Brassica napus]CAF1937424.1 unnamed protein product [Brassica napus]